MHIGREISFFRTLLKLTITSYSGCVAALQLVIAAQRQQAQTRLEIMMSEVRTQFRYRLSPISLKG
jgi:hypothetical protein